MSKRPGFATIALTVVLALPRLGQAGTVSGKLELPAPPERPPSASRGFLDRVPNQITDVQPVPVAPYLIVVLENDKAPENPAEVAWDLVGESFNKPVVAVPVGAQLVIHNTTKTPRTLTAVEDAKLVDGIINPEGKKPVKITAAKVYSVSALNAQHVRGKIVGVNTTHIATVDVNGKFELEASEGSYKLRVFYRAAWTDREETVTVPAKGKVDVTVKGSLTSPAKK